MCPDVADTSNAACNADVSNDGEQTLWQLMVLIMMTLGQTPEVAKALLGAGKGLEDEDLRSRLQKLFKDAPEKLDSPMSKRLLGFEQHFNWLYGWQRANSDRTAALESHFEYIQYKLNSVRTLIDEKVKQATESWEGSLNDRIRELDLQCRKNRSSIVELHKVVEQLTSSDKAQVTESLVDQLSNINIVDDRVPGGTNLQDLGKAVSHIVEVRYRTEIQRYWKQIHKDVKCAIMNTLGDHQSRLDDEFKLLQDRMQRQFGEHLRARDKVISEHQQLQDRLGAEIRARDKMIEDQFRESRIQSQKLAEYEATIAGFQDRFSRLEEFLTGRNIQLPEMRGQGTHEHTKNPGVVTSASAVPPPVSAADESDDDSIEVIHSSEAKDLA